jgi:UTP--glucose-1-phosphate uridylyltransferase
MKITKAVFPVAGLGTRFFPATKVIAKEMLPVVDKPIIQYATEEAINAGITELIFVISKTKTSIQEHYNRMTELEQELETRNKLDLLKTITDILPAGISCAYVEQPKALGLGHAVLCARPLVGNEPFAVILPDDMIDDDASGCLSQMVRVYQDHPHSIIAIEAVNPQETDKYGIVSITPMSGPLHKIDAIVEKPGPEVAPSNLAVVGRYILSGAIFDYLTNLGKGAGGEIQLTDGIAALLKSEPVLAYEFKGTRYDCGSKLGYLKAMMNYGLKHAEVKQEFSAFLDQEIRPRL